MPSDAERLSQAVDFHRSGDLKRAEEIYREVIRGDPDNADALHLLGVAAQQQENHAAAVDFISRAIAVNSSSPAFHSNLGVAYSGLDHFEKAVTSYREALRLSPEYTDAIFNLANSYKSLGNLDGAAAQYKQYLQLVPEGIEALIELAAVREKQQKLPEAIKCLQRIVEIEPRNVDVLNNLGSMLKSAGLLDEAISAYQRLIEISPGFAAAYNNLGNVFKLQRNLDEAVRYYKTALELDPQCASTQANLATVLHDLGMMDEAVEHNRRAIMLDPRPVRRIKDALLLPPIYESTDKLHQWRNRLEANVDRLLQEQVTIDPAKELVLPNFYLAYQGLNDGEMQNKISRLYRSSFEPGQSVSSRNEHTDGRIHVGFVSRYFKNHTIGRLMRGVIAELSRERFHVTVITHDVADDEISQIIFSDADEVVELSDELPAACNQIASQHLDILFYADIGMDPLVTSLAHSWLAKVQMATWGHPVTTGIDTVDYFVSSALFEPNDSSSHYSEKLVNFESTSTFYYRPQITLGAKSRSDFGMPKDKTLYACLQSLFKLHPEFDEMLGEILRRDPNGLLVLLCGPHKQWETLLMKRLQAVIPDVEHRIVFLPRQSYDDFLQLYSLVDVLLDPMHFSGGNTSLEAFTLGTPIVTLPLETMRGRVTYGFYQKMGVLDCVATTRDEYVDIAVRLGTDRNFRQQVSNKILAANDCLFEDRQVIEEFEQLFERVCTDEKLPSVDILFGSTDGTSSIRDASPISQGEAVVPRPKFLDRFLAQKQVGDKAS